MRFSAGREEMAVRRQLRRFFEEPQIRGTIVVERPLSSEPPPAPAPAPAPVSEVPQCYELRAEDCAVFQCRGCWAVLGDSLHLCALEEQRLGLVVCLSQCCGPGWGWFRLRTLLLHALLLSPQESPATCCARRS